MPRAVMLEAVKARAMSALVPQAAEDVRPPPFFSPFAHYYFMGVFPLNFISTLVFWHIDHYFTARAYL